MHLNSALLFEKYATPHFTNSIKVLEIGPAGHPSAYQKAVGNQSITWHTMDFASTTYIEGAQDHLTFRLNSPYIFPIEDDSYDIVVSGQVIEHVQNIFTWLKEIKRVIKPDGLVITINPVSWPYHEAPIDCWRIFPDGIKALADEVGFSIVHCLFESLEAETIKTMDKDAVLIPGKSYNYTQSAPLLQKKIRWNKLIRKIPRLKNLAIPIEVAFDTISVLKKTI